MKNNSMIFIFRKTNGEIFKRVTTILYDIIDENTFCYTGRSLLSAYLSEEKYTCSIELDGKIGDVIDIKSDKRDIIVKIIKVKWRKTGDT